MSEIIESVSQTQERYLTAFVVLVSEDGTPKIIADLEPEHWFMNHKATPREIRRAVLEISADFSAQAVVDSMTVLLSKPEPPSTSEMMADALAKRSDAWTSN